MGPWGDANLWISDSVTLSQTSVYVTRPWIGASALFDVSVHAQAFAGTKLYCLLAGKWVWTTCLRSLLDSAATGAQTHNHRVTNLMPYALLCQSAVGHYKTLIWSQVHSSACCSDKQKCLKLPLHLISCAFYFIVQCSIQVLYSCQHYYVCNPQEPFISFGCTLVPPGKYSWMIHARQECGLSLPLQATYSLSWFCLWHLMLLKLHPIREILRWMLWRREVLHWMNVRVDRCRDSTPMLRRLFELLQRQLRLWHCRSQSLVSCTVAEHSCRTRITTQLYYLSEDVNSRQTVANRFLYSPHSEDV